MTYIKQSIISISVYPSYARKATERIDSELLVNLIIVRGIHH